MYVIDYKQSMHRQAVGDAKSKVNGCHVQEVIGAVEATTIRDAMRCLTNPKFNLIRREDSHFNEAKRSKWEMNRLNYI
ncbi:hypothetical protein, partial [Geobacillus stearothermophilus]|uniref:hypothetical protein n=3 Tax=Geobacillus stearothermophilus TaxID=1422 RepID=UPI000AB53F1F